MMSRSTFRTPVELNTTVYSSSSPGMTGIRFDADYHIGKEFKNQRKATYMIIINGQRAFSSLWHAYESQNNPALGPVAPAEHFRCTVCASAELQ